MRALLCVVASVFALSPTASAEPILIESISAQILPETESITFTVVFDRPFEIMNPEHWLGIEASRTFGPRSDSQNDVHANQEFFFSSIERPGIQGDYTATYLWYFGESSNPRDITELGPFTGTFVGNSFTTTLTLAEMQFGSHDHVSGNRYGPYEIELYARTLDSSVRADAFIPEPSSVALASLGVVFLLVHRVSARKRKTPPAISRRRTGQP